ncbi:hypothetical protein [Leucobacter sp. M11]|uniref:hypothetical protein n=1 Tax=Leucobacter sp. M11 TaxID=2993565 RepID=UPI002D7F3FBB|nr:hypothetical protein [Leucobacter sp. M11]MEB4616203.1 hypothetical protein [Leucobacter sp. M11]
MVLILSAFLMATGAMVMERLLSSISQLFDEAKPPHFLQMHTGDYDQSALQGFADQHEEIQSWLIEQLLGFDSAAIGWNRSGTGESGDFSDRLIDNLFVTQHTEFDFLVGMDGSMTVEVMNALTDAHRAGSTIVMVTHDPKCAARADRVVYLRDGRLVDERAAGAWTEQSADTRADDLLAWLRGLGF